MALLCLNPFLDFPSNGSVSVTTILLYLQYKMQVVSVLIKFHVVSSSWAVVVDLYVVSVAVRRPHCVGLDL
jgi:hypothetical protein